MTWSTPSRRALLGGLCSAGLLAPGLSRALAGADRRFVFVWSDGGWDPLAVFAPMFGRRDIEMDARAEPWTVGGLPLVDHPDRPAVRSFFDAHAAACVVVGGLSVPSVSHDICALLAMTGSGDGQAPDWPTRLAEARASAYVLPSVVVSGPSFTADRGGVTARLGGAGQLQALVDGRITGRTPTLSVEASRGVDDALVRILGRSNAPGARDLADSVVRARQLEGSVDALGLGAVETADDRSRVAARVLGSGLARVVTLGSPYGLYWDSHANNESVQTAALEELFGALTVLMEGLASTPSPQGGVLLDDTIVVCLSEMGRTPRLNAGAGRDHWPFTSALLFGGGLSGGRAVSGYDDGFNGLGCDPATGAIDPARPALTPAHLGASLLSLADVDPAEVLPGVAPIGPLVTG
ncbi:MAG: DUF1501 domain-containing protein [Myxococcota bacterium]